MNRINAINKLRVMDDEGKYVFHKSDMYKLFPEDTPKALDEGLRRLVKAGILRRACSGIYVNEHARSFDSRVLYYIARALRRGNYTFVSLESMLAEYGLISQIPLDRLTLMTTGRSGTYSTPYGVIEFTHTKRALPDLLNSIKIMPDRPLRVATQKAAVRDLKRVGRNTHLLQLERGEYE